MKKILIIVYSYHHMNTERVAHVIADKLEAEIKKPDEINIDEIQNYDLVGFGAGIDSGKHYSPILELANSLPEIKNKKAFVFSTSAIWSEKKMAKDHSTLKNILVSKGYNVVDEFSCVGFNTNLFLKWFGGMNKGRPNKEDFLKAEEFADNLNKAFVEL